MPNGGVSTPLTLDPKLIGHWGSLSVMFSYRRRGPVSRSSSVSLSAPTTCTSTTHFLYDIGYYFNAYTYTWTNLNNIYLVLLFPKVCLDVG